MMTGTYKENERRRWKFSNEHRAVHSLFNMCINSLTFAWYSKLIWHCIWLFKLKFVDSLCSLYWGDSPLQFTFWKIIGLTSTLRNFGVFLSLSKSFDSDKCGHIWIHSKIHRLSSVFQHKKHEHQIHWCLGWLSLLFFFYHFVSCTFKINFPKFFRVKTQWYVSGSTNDISVIHAICKYANNIFLEHTQLSHSLLERKGESRCFSIHTSADLH